MNKDKQIEEMAKDLQETHDYEGCEAWHCGGCEYEKYGKGYFCSSIKQAEKMIAKGYRKASEVAEEVIRKMEQIVEVKIIGIEEDFFYGTSSLGDATRKKCYVEILNELAELKKKYTEEITEGGE